MEARREQSLAAEKLPELESQLASGANWFYWVAVLTLINSIIAMTQSGWIFVFGLGTTQFIEGVSLGIAEEVPELESAAAVLAILVNLTIISTCALFGFFANREHQWAFGVGLILYGLDALIFFAVADYISFGFHALALFGIYRGLWALQQLRQSSADRPPDLAQAGLTRLQSGSHFS